jgi:hypothetical protein
MTVQQADLFHCLACGRVAYEPHGGPAPDCCGQPMVRAVADVARSMTSGSAPNSAGADSAATDITEHALFAEVVELAQWCHGLQDVDISRSEELANRLSVLYQALVDQFEDLHQPEPTAARSSREQSPERVSEQVDERGRSLVASFGRLVAQLRNGPFPFGSWAQVCDRMDELVTEFRQYVEAESGQPAEAPAPREQTTG